MSYWQDQVILITGGSGAVGQAMVKHFTKLGAKVAVNFHSNESRATEFVHSLKSEKVKCYKADVSQEKDVDQMFLKIESELGPVTILINNAGIVVNSLMFLTSIEEWRRMIDTHLTGAFLCSRRALREMIKKKFGRVINISSISAFDGHAGQTSYAAAKAGLIGFTRALSQEVGTKGITCNAVALGLLDTENSRKNVSAEMRKRRIENSPLKRIGEVVEVVPTIEYLASQDSSMMTGQTLNLG